VEVEVEESGISKTCKGFDGSLVRRMREGTSQGQVEIEEPEIDWACCSESFFG
jgi:hypothetical protein